MCRANSSQNPLPRHQSSDGNSGQPIVNAGDVDGDGRPELLVGGRANVLSVFRNLGLGTLTTNSFAASVDFSMTGWVHNVVLGTSTATAKPDPVVVGELGSYLAVFQNQKQPGQLYRWIAGGAWILGRGGMLGVCRWETWTAMAGLTSLFAITTTKPSPRCIATSRRPLAVRP